MQRTVVPPASEGDKRHAVMRSEQVEPGRIIPTQARAAIVGAVVLLTVAASWIDASPTGLIQCTRDCGETLISLQYVDNVRVYGLRYWVVEDIATSPDPGAHPYLYTHNVNFGGLYFTAFELVGVRPFWAKQLGTVAGFGLGLLYAYRATAYLSRSWLAGLATLLFFATDVGQVLPFALNPLRTWHWLALFGTLFHVGRLAREPGARPRTDAVAILLLAALGFALGYDYWVICGALAVSTLVLFQARPRRVVRLLKQAVFLGAAFAIPVILRQAQIIAVLGPSFWFDDLVYSAAIKVGTLSRVIPVPPESELDAIYRAAGVVRAPASPTSSWGSIIATFREMVGHLLLPDVGFVALGLACLGGVLAAGGVLLVLLCPSRVLVGLLARVGIVGEARRRLLGAALLIAALSIAVLAGLVFFAPLSLHYFLKHRFPLLAAPLAVVKGILLATLVCWSARTDRCRPRLVRRLAVVLAVLLVADHAIVQVRTARSSETMSLAWIDEVTARRDASFAVSYIPNTASVFTSSWAVGVPPGRERLVAERIRMGQLPFAIDEYLLFGLRDVAERAEAYRRPDYWLYFRTDLIAPYDSPAPTCRQDYLFRLFEWLRLGPEPQPALRELWVQSRTVRPGDVLRIGGQIDRFGDTRFRAELLLDGQVVGPLNFDCLRARFLGEYRIPSELPPGPRDFSARLIAPSGHVFPMGDATITIDLAAPPSTPLLVGAQPPQPTPDELIALLPAVPVAARGDDFVIFDLRSIYGRLR